MPCINDVVAENMQRNELEKALSCQVRPTRFVFDPSKVSAVLEKRIIGQPELQSAVNDMLHVVKADFRDTEKPLAVFLFAGSTGVGKTETVRVLAEEILGSAEKLCRIDMNTLAQEHYAAAITGAPPGYVGSKENHTLFDLDKVAGSFGKPGLVLFDEVEKASSSVARALLNVLDAGVLKLSAGTKEISFKNSLIFMTSNQGSKELEAYRQKFKSGWRKWLGLESKAEREQEILQEALRSKFDPEFLNRIDKVVFFADLGEGRAEKLLAVEVEKLNGRLEKKGVAVEVDTPALDFLAKGYDKRYGAREVARRVRDVLEPPIAKAMLENPGCGLFSVRCEQESLSASPLAVGS